VEEEAMPEHILRRCCVEAWRHETAGNVIVFLIAGIFGAQLTATAGNALTLVAERWKFGDHPPTLEVSTKVDESIAEETTAKLVKFMRDKKFEQDKDPETKTSEVLEYFTSPK